MDLLDKINKKNKEKRKITTELLDLKKKYEIDFIKVDNKNKNKLVLLDGKKKVLIGNYNFYGIFQKTTNLWIWASSIPGVDKDHIKNINKLKQAHHLFENDNNPSINFYYQLLTQDVIQITNNKLLNEIISLILYLTDDIMCFTPTNNENNMQFITMSKISEKYI